MVLSSLGIVPSVKNVLHYGGAMLVYSRWKDIDLLAKERSDLVVICHEATEPESFKPVRAALAGGVLSSQLRHGCYKCNFAQLMYQIIVKYCQIFVHK